MARKPKKRNYQYTRVMRVIDGDKVYFTIPPRDNDRLFITYTNFQLDKEMNELVWSVHDELSDTGSSEVNSSDYESLIESSKRNFQKLFINSTEESLYTDMIEAIDYALKNGVEYGIKRAYREIKSRGTSTQTVIENELNIDIDNL